LKSVRPRCAHGGPVCVGVLGERVGALSPARAPAPPAAAGPNRRSGRGGSRR